MLFMLVIIWSIKIVKGRFARFDPASVGLQQVKCLETRAWKKKKKIYDMIFKTWLERPHLDAICMQFKLA